MLSGEHASKWLRWLVYLLSTKFDLSDLASCKRRAQKSRERSIKYSWIILQQQANRQLIYMQLQAKHANAQKSMTA